MTSFSHKEHTAFWDLGSSFVLKYNHALDVLPMGIDVLLLEVELALELGDAIDQDNPSSLPIKPSYGFNFSISVKILKYRYRCTALN